ETAVPISSVGKQPLRRSRWLLATVICVMCYVAPPHTTLCRTYVAIPGGNGRSRICAVHYISHQPDIVQQEHHWLTDTMESVSKPPVVIVLLSNRCIPVEWYAGN